VKYIEKDDRIIVDN